MIVNCFSVLRSINVRYDDWVKTAGHRYANASSIRRVHRAIVETFEMGEEASSDCFIALVQGGPEALTSFAFTGAEARLITTVINWWSGELGDEYEDGWGMKTRVTPHFVFENHNRAIGIMLHRSGRKE